MTEAMTEAEIRPSHGQRAATPGKIPPSGWWDITKRVVNQAGADHISLIAAGVAFYSFLAVFPALAAVVSIYGAFTDPGDIQAQLRSLLGLVPVEIHNVLGEQLHNVTVRNEQTLGWTAAIALLLALWSANKGTNALLEGLNIAYNEAQSRGFLRRTALGLLFTVGTATGMTIALAVVVGTAALSASLQVPTWFALAVTVIGWLLIALMALAGLAMLYKYAPVRTDPKVRWVSIGSIVSLLMWLAGSAAFSLYVANFGSYADTYGSIAAIVIFLLWLYLSAYIVLLGAEINSESEHQTMRDTTIGVEKPMGERGAWHADHVAKV
jgi:membrane protein